MFEEYRVVFWDFDGVIKDSVPVKTKAYLDLFPSVPKEISDKIQDHHLRYGGVSRMKKIPLYLEWAGLPTDEVSILDFSLKFASLVVDAVVNSPWILGVKEVLEAKSNSQTYVLVTGTPQDEIELILEKLNLLEKFDYIFGSPMEKSNAIGTVVSKMKITPADCLLIGDSETDWDAANSMGISFILRSDRIDPFSQKFKGKVIKDFKEYI